MLGLLSLLLLVLLVLLVLLSLLLLISSTNLCLLFLPFLIPLLFLYFQVILEIFPLPYYQALRKEVPVLQAQAATGHCRDRDQPGGCQTP